MYYFLPKMTDRVCVHSAVEMPLLAWTPLPTAPVGVGGWSYIALDPGPMEEKSHGDPRRKV